VETPRIIPIPGFERYGITVVGEVFSRRHGCWHPIALFTKGKGGDYFKVKLYRDRRSYQFSVHSLVARVFIGPRPDPSPDGQTFVVNHKDGNKQNNSYTNLEYCTHKQNIEHARHTGLVLRSVQSAEERRARRRASARRRRMRQNERKIVLRAAGLLPPRRMRRGTQLQNAKLTDELVMQMHVDSAMFGVSMSGLGRKYGVSKQQAQRIICGKKWKHIGDPLNCWRALGCLVRSSFDELHSYLTARSKSIEQHFPSA
jgi:hypothetical protein